MTTAEGPVSGGKWGSSAPRPRSESGIYTAVAVEQSSLENAQGESCSGHVRDQHEPSGSRHRTGAGSTRSKENKPTFKGTASEAGIVTVKVFKGTEAKGEEVAKLSTTGQRKAEWTVSVPGTLADGKYTVQATEPSGDRERAGVQRSRPVRSLHESADGDDGRTGGAFEGKQTHLQRDGREPGEVTVHVFKGKEAKGTEATKFTATVGSKGEWSVSPADGARGRNLHRGCDRAERDRERTEAKANRGYVHRLHGTADREDHPGCGKTLEA